MKITGTMVTTHVNRKGYKITREAIENVCVKYNNSKFKMPILLQHDYTLGILGVVEKVWVEKLEDGEYALRFSGLLFDDSSKIFEYNFQPFLRIVGDEKEFQIIATPDCQYKYGEGLVEKLIPEISELKNKYNLIELTPKVNISEFGVEVSNTLIPFHSFFRRNHSIVNSFNFDFIHEIIKCYKKYSNTKFFVRLSDNYLYYEKPQYYVEFDYWRGPKFSKNFNELETGVTVHYYPTYKENILNVYNISKTEFWIKETNRGTKELTVEEIRLGNTSILYDQKDYHFTRFMHAEFDITSNKVIHFDLSIRVYSKCDYKRRIDSNDIKEYQKKYGKASKREKILQVNGQLNFEDLLNIVYKFFHSNILLAEFFEHKVTTNV